jgi:hypothetical protein
MTCGSAKSETPTCAYIFPAGGQRGTTVPVRIGGHFLHNQAEFRIEGAGVSGRSPIARTDTIWFEGPLLLLPASQQKEDYPKDYAGEIKIVADAPMGLRIWHCTTSQGITPGMKFVVGDLPEVVEEEIEGREPPQAVSLPITINGRIFPREDVDDWSFELRAGQVVTCEVQAARIGSGLDSHLQVFDPQGKVVAENADSFDADSFVRFQAERDGRHVVRIFDARFGGLQHFVYRLTISTGPWLDWVYPLGGRRGTTIPLKLTGANLPADRIEFRVPEESANGPSSTIVSVPSAVGPSRVVFETDELPEHLEAEPNNESANALMVELPAVLNGRIDQPGDSDRWSFVGKKGETWQFDLRASRLGSPLDGVLTLLDEAGKQIATADDFSSGQTDAILSTKLPADGTYTLVVEDRLRSRGGDEFAYRVRIVSELSDVPRLTLQTDAVSLARGAETRVRILAERPQGFAEEISFDLEGLPEGVTCTGNKLGKNQKQVDLVLKAADSAKLGTSVLRIVGKWKSGDQERQVVAEPARHPGEPATQRVLLHIGLATPFKLKGNFETKYAPRGSVFTRRYRIERNGFPGPMWVELADRQARYLQGVTGPRLEIAADQSEFEYPFTLAPNMEIGRTSRTCLAVFGELTEPDGRKHIVSHSSQEQNDQAIVIVEPNRLNIETTQLTIRRVPGGEARIPFRLSRDAKLSGPARVELQIPRTLVGLNSEAVEVPEGSNTGELTLRFSREDNLPPEARKRTVKNLPEAVLRLQASLVDEHGHPTVDAVDIRLISAD